MKNPRIRLGLLCSSLLLTACDPKHETTSDLCSAGEDSPVVANYTSFQVDREERGEYQFYLQNMLMGMTPATGETVTAETQEVLDNILVKINKYMHYEIEDGVVRSANNPLDFVEHLIASTDEDKVIGAFEDAQVQVAEGIAADDGVCNYTNSNIELSIPDTDPAPGPENDNGTYYKATYSLTYTPFERDFVQQALVLQQSTTSDDDSTERLLTPYSSIYQAPTENFKTAGFTVPALRQAIMNNPEGTESVSFDDGVDQDLGQIQFETLNTYCELDKEHGTADPSQFVVSADRDGDGVVDGDLNGDLLVNSNDYKSCAEVYAGSNYVPVIRTPKKAQCGATGVEDEQPSESGWFGDFLDWVADELAEPAIDETGKIEIRSFDLSSSDQRLMGLQRVRIEVEYKDEGNELDDDERTNGIQETRIYGSKYREAIYDPVDTLDIIPGVTPYIENPTRCETQAVLDELFDVAQSGVHVTARPDPNYDITYETDEDGEFVLDEDDELIVIEPTPLITFRGRPVVLEQPCAENCTVTVDSEAITLNTASYLVTPGSLYDLYAADLLRELTPANADALTEDQQGSHAAIMDRINAYLGYDLNLGIASSGDNPLDYLGNLVRSQSNPHLQAAFNEFAECLEARNKTCVYSNDDISIGNTTTNADNAGTYQLHYSPLAGQVTQSWQMAESIADAVQTYTVADTIRPEDFSTTEKLKTLAQIDDRNKIDYLNIEDTASAGELLFVAQNAYCDTSLANRSPTATPDDFNPATLANCGGEVSTRPPAKDECSAEANKVELRSFELGNLTGLQRLRVEVDYTTHQTHIFTSGFVEKIRDSVGEAVITNPTNCEKAAVLAELLADDDPDNNSLTYILDENFDEDAAEPALSFVGIIPLPPEAP